MKAVFTKMSFVALAATMLWACLPDTEQDIQKLIEEKIRQEKELIDKYVVDSKLTWKTTDSNLNYIIENQGSGELGQPGDTLKVHYKGRFLNGAVFDSTSVPGKKTLNFVIGNHQLISGFVEGAQMLKTGGKGVFLLPSSLAYGSVGAPPIGAYTPIIFDIWMSEIAKKK